MEGVEFDFVRSEDKDATSSARIEQLADAYLAKARRNGGQGAAISAIDDYFKSFNNELRQAMFEEPIRFFVDMVGRDLSVLDFLYGDHTFVNPVLAAHYGMPDLEARSNEWVRIDDAHSYERGGLLPMSVFLTKNAPGLRTSPVKRGYWVVRRLLGEEIPPPPPKVPELPKDEAELGDLTLREVLTRHREDKSCAGCHARFDPVGLVFEGYGPIGERRVTDPPGCRSSWLAAWAARWKPVECWTTPTKATTIASSAACTCHSWTAWELSWIASAMPTPAWQAFGLRRASVMGTRREKGYFAGARLWRSPAAAHRNTPNGA